MSLEIVNEKSSYFPTISFLDEDGNAVIPSAGKYWVYDITDQDAPVEIKAETAFTPTASSFDFEILPTENRILDDTNDYEMRVLTVEFTYSTTRQGTAEHKWGVKNLHGESGA